MKTMVLFSLLLICAGNVFAMNVPGATETGILNDCQVTAELSVMLLKMKAKTPPEKLFQTAVKMLKDKGYQGSFGDAEFIARMYTGSALQMGAEVDQVMAAISGEDLETMVNEHEMSCLEKAMTELESSTTPPHQSNPGPR